MEVLPLNAPPAKKAIKKSVPEKKKRPRGRRRAGKPEFDYDLIVIGSGPSGQKAAIQASKFEKRVALVEKSTVVGGVCIVVGVYSLTFPWVVITETDFQLR